MIAKKDVKPVKKREFSLDIWTVLRNADTNNLLYYESLTVEEKKALQPFVLMRWLSAVSNDNPFAEHYIVAVNDIVNVGFFELAKYPDLQWKLLAVCGSGKSQSHAWIKGPERITTNKLDNLILRLNPSLNDLELSLAKNKFTKDGITQLCRDFAMDNSEIRPIVEEFKKYQNRKNISS